MECSVFMVEEGRFRFVRTVLNKSQKVAYVQRDNGQRTTSSLRKIIRYRR